MEPFGDSSVWVIAGLVFLARVTDVTIGTMRTLAVVQGRIRLSVLFGFFEVLVWATAITKVVTSLESSVVVLFAYALGYAAGNATGILLERKLSFGSVVVRMISATASQAIAEHVRSRGHWATVFVGQGKNGHEDMVYASCPRRQLRSILTFAKSQDPDLIYAVEALLDSGPELRQPFPQPTGWRALFMRK